MKPFKDFPHRPIGGIYAAAIGTVCEFGARLDVLDQVGPRDLQNSFCPFDINAQVA